MGPILDETSIQSRKGFVYGVTGPDLRHRQVALEGAGTDDLDAVVEAGQDAWAMTIESIPLQSPYSY